MVPPETPQEREQRGRRLDRTPQSPFRSANRQGVRAVNTLSLANADALASTYSRRHWLDPAQCGVNVVVHQFAQSQMMGQGDAQKQPCIGQRAMIVKGDADAVWLLVR